MKTTARTDPDVARDAATLELLVEVLRRGNRQRIIARGGSMSAAIPHGAQLTLAPLTRPARLGEVVAIATPQVGLVIHRVVGIDARGQLLVKGDTCPSPDGWFAPTDVAAIVDDVDGHPVSLPRKPPPRWRRGLRRLLALFR